MASPISPGLYVNELDFPQFQQAVGTTRVCIVGAASKGPLNKPTPISNQGSLVEKFGPPLLTDSGLQSAMQFLAAGYQLIFVRISHSAATADRTLAGLTGGTPAVKATGYIQFVGSVNPADGDYVTISDGTTSRIFEFDNNNAITGGHIGVSIGTTAAATMANLIVAINNSNVVTAVDGTLTAPRTNLTAKVGGTAGNVTITASQTGSVIGLSGMSSGAIAVAGSSTNVLKFFATSPGSWGNSIQVQVVTPSVVPGADAANFDIFIYAPPVFGAKAVVVERFTNLSLDPLSTRFIESVLANGLANEYPASNYLTADALTTGTPTAGTFTLSQSGGTVGTDGVSGLVPADYVGTVSGQAATGLKSIRNAESSEYSLLLIPGVSHATVVAAMIEQAEFRQDHLVLIDPPFGLDVSSVKQWVDGLQPAGVANSPASPLVSSYASVSWPWHQVYDSYNKKNVWVPPSAFTARIMAQGADTPWLPAAGPNRGVVPSLDIEYSPDQSERDTLYDSNINPFVKFSTGIQRYGNKTLQRDTLLTQSEHARRTLIYAQKLCAGSVRYLTWEPNDPVTWRKFESLCNTALGSMKSARGLQYFAVVCDANTNPPEQRARKEMRGYLVAQPPDIAEKIIMSFSSTNTGTTYEDTQIVTT